MKKLFIVVLVLSVSLSDAQNYQNICSPGVTLYKSVTGNFKAFRLDSIELPGSYDTLFISYLAIRDDLNYGCFDTTNGSILGRTILKKSNGWFYFFNMSHDSIRLNTQATQGGTWKFIDLPDKGYVRAEITGSVTDSVLGTTDIVKIITFQAKDSNNLNISHVLNQRSIKLSQHYGLSQMFDVHFIPNDTVLYDLAGKSNPQVGLQDLTWEKVYDYEVDDEFHFQGGEYFPINYPYEQYVYYKSEIYHVLEKISFGNDSVTYLMEYCRADTTYIPPTSTRVHDTIAVTYHFDQLNNYTWFFRLPEEFINGFNVADLYIQNFFGNRQTKTFRWGEYVITEWSPGCWLYYNHECPDEKFIYKYSEGLGTSHYQQDCYGLGGAHIHSKWNTLVYYKKGSVEWGNPVALDCFVLTGNEEQKVSQTSLIEVVPNPAEKEVKIKLTRLGSSDGFHYSLYNVFGTRVLRGTSNLNPFTISVEELSLGLYLLVVYEKDGNVKGSARILRK
jgi:hypothetical protein